MMRSFDGARVVDLSDRLSGAFAARLFGDFSAEVIMVEPPEGHLLRAEPPFLDDSPANVVGMVLGAVAVLAFRAGRRRHDNGRRQKRIRTNLAEAEIALLAQAALPANRGMTRATSVELGAFNPAPRRIA